MCFLIFNTHDLFETLAQVAFHTLIMICFLLAFLLNSDIIFRQIPYKGKGVELYLKAKKLFRMSHSKVKRRIGKYEVGRTIGEGTFAKVKFARNSETGDAVAIKILEKEKVLKHKMAEQVIMEKHSFIIMHHCSIFIQLE